MAGLYDTTLQETCTSEALLGNIKDISSLLEFCTAIESGQMTAFATAELLKRRIARLTPPPVLSARRSHILGGSAGCHPHPETEALHLHRADHHVQKEEEWQLVEKGPQPSWSPAHCLTNSTRQSLLEHTQAVAVTTGPHHPHLDRPLGPGPPQSVSGSSGSSTSNPKEMYVGDSL